MLLTIKKVPEKPKTPFYCLKPGSVFIYDGDLWMKFSKKEYDNSINIKNGETSYFDPQAEFQLYNIEEIIISKID